ncbi:PaMKK3 MAPK kinase encoded by the PaMKK3 protein [Podospora aff. communis PSN243]|uniref:mitogen-activated protein kinase kinase n=1 Tax=Podospora aff. communis PSN243 TaxID=3040156 RepID=A0AAV9GH15_9PEZI|nr:PaMKK3 MAPK kinase encoded by the PaMKK3 protein [Podospora aff. communis PSN243]
MADRDRHSSPETPDEFIESNPVSPGSADESSEASTPLDHPIPSPDGLPRRVPSLRTVSDPQQSSTMSPSSTVSGILNTARRPPPSVNGLPLDIMEKARALQQQRMGMGMAGRPSMASPPGSSLGQSPGGMGSPMAMNLNTNSGGALAGGVPSNLRLPGGMNRPLPPGFPKSAPVVPSAVGRKAPSLSERRAMKLGGMGSPGSPAGGATPKLSDINGGNEEKEPSINGEGRGSKLSDFKNYIDADKGWITFEGAATITRTGVNFANGRAFAISLDEVEVLDELGKGNYGTVYKVRHAKPKAPRFGQGLRGSKNASRQSSSASEADESGSESTPMSPSSTSSSNRHTTGVVMAMKEIRLELDENKFTTILKELVILHECVSPHIIDFYGAFYQEGAVYMCIEYMDGGSIDKLYEGGIPENVLRKITYSTIMGLKTLKDDHNIIHRDVKPTNILANTNGQVKICDFGVSGNLVASIAKTNIGCQSYMAPERISGGGMSSLGGASGTYNVQSDIWSLGLTIIECAMGRYPYPPEVSSTIFSQLSAIVEGDPPDLPSEGYSQLARDFVRSCLNKIPTKRHTYPMLLAHPWIKSLSKPETIDEDAEAEDAAADDELADAAGALNLSGPTDGSGGDYEVAEWVNSVLERKQKGLLEGTAQKPALHAAPLDSVSPVGSPMIPA